MPVFLYNAILTYLCFPPRSGVMAEPVAFVLKLNLPTLHPTPVYQWIQIYEKIYVFIYSLYKQHRISKVCKYFICIPVIRKV